MLPILLKELLNIKIRIMNIHTLCLKNKSYLVSLVEIYLFTSPEASMLDVYVIPLSMMHFYPIWPCELLTTLGICHSSVFLSDVNNIKNLLLWNHWANFNQTWSVSYLGHLLSKLYLMILLNTDEEFQILFVHSLC